MCSLNKEFHRLLKRVGRLSDGQANIENINWDDGNLETFNVVLRPNSGHYKGGTFEFEVNIMSSYDEDTAPVIRCLTDIYHPNIDTSEDNRSEDSSNICLNLFDNSHSAFGLEGLVHGLIFLLKYPNLDDPLSPYFEGYGDTESFSENVIKYMAGEEVDGTLFNTPFCVIDGVPQEKVAPEQEKNTTECVAVNTCADNVNGAQSDDTTAQAEVITDSEAKEVTTEKLSNIITDERMDDVTGVVTNILDELVSHIDDTDTKKDFRRSISESSAYSACDNTIGKLVRSTSLCDTGEKLTHEEILNKILAFNTQCDNSTNAETMSSMVRNTEQLPSTSVSCTNNNGENTETATNDHSDGDLLDEDDKLDMARLELISIDDEVYLVYRETDAPFVIEESEADIVEEDLSEQSHRLSTNTLSTETELPETNTVNESTREQREPENTGSADMSGIAHGELTNPSELNTLTLGTCVDTGRPDVRMEMIGDMSDSHEVTTQCQTFAIVRTAFMKLLYLFSCSMKAYKRVKM